MTFHMWARSIMSFILRGRRSIWWSWRMTLVAPRIVNDLPYVSTVNHDIHFEWQAPYLLRCVGDACSIYFTGNICASCLCVSAHYTTKFVSPRSISSSNIILRNSFHPSIASDNPSISFALPCCIRLPKTFVALQCMIFFYRLTCFL